MKEDSRRRKMLTALPGVPLGGIGAGCVELGPDGYFRNITINNNRTPEERIPFSPASCFAVQVANRHGKYARRLQLNLPGKSRQETDDLFLAHETLEWRGIYPTARYQLKDPKCPASIAWNAFNPIIPFDVSASTLPAVFVGFHCANPTPDAMEISLLFNWENLCGRTATQEPTQNVRSYPVSVEETAETLADAELPDAPGESDFSTLPCNGLVFEVEGGAVSNADGQHCIVVHRTPNLNISLALWDHTNPDEERQFWESFRQNGQPHVPFRGKGARASGAICASFTLPPDTARQVDFALSWYCPRYSIRGVEVGNGYTNQFKSAAEVLEKNLINSPYYLSSINTWQQYLLDATLPANLRELLVNCNSVFSTNTIQAQDGRVALLSSPREPMAGHMDRRLYTSLGMLLFFPRFEENELNQHIQTLHPGNPRLLQSWIQQLSLRGSILHEEWDNPVLRAAVLILSCYRNYTFTSNHARIREVEKPLEELLQAVCLYDTNHDGLPESEDIFAATDGTRVRGYDCHTCSLWIAAVAAWARLLELRKRLDEAKVYKQLAKKAARTFEARFWDETREQFRLGAITESESDDPEEAESFFHTGQLAGQWYANFLGLGPLFSPEKVQQSMKSITQNNCREGLLCSTPDAPEPSKGPWAWPAFNLANHTSLWAHEGDCTQALKELDAYLQHPAYPRSLVTGPPSMLPQREADAHSDYYERHAAGLAIWHLLFAIEGLELNLPEKRLRIAPNLPENTGAVRLPLFLPACLGWIEYEEVLKPEYEQTVLLNFDSPIAVEAVELRIPKTLSEIDVKYGTAEDEMEAFFTREEESRGDFISIELRGTAKATKLLKFIITEAEETQEEVIEEKPSFLRRFLGGKKA
jgi:uncharacterized protein (DUF608 family)